MDILCGTLVLFFLTSREAGDSVSFTFGAFENLTVGAFVLFFLTPSEEGVKKSVALTTGAFVVRIVGTLVRLVSL